LTGYKLPDTEQTDGGGYATLRGPFRRVTDELGQTYARGIAQAVDRRTIQFLKTPSLTGLFLLTERPMSLDASDPRLCAVLPEHTPCVWKGDYAVLTGPYAEVHDDDHPVYRRGRPLEICSKTLKVLQSEAYRPHFAVINRATAGVSDTAVSCNPDGTCC
jgi:hypothetical protein